MNFVIVAFLSQAMCTYNIGYLGRELDINHKNPEEDYFAITDKALIRVLLTIAYNLEAKQYEDNTYDVKKIEDFFSVETQLFNLLVEYYEMKSKDVGHDQNRGKNLNELGEKILNLSDSFDEAYYLAFQSNSDVKNPLNFTGIFALEEFQKMIEDKIKTEMEIENSTQNPLTNSTPDHDGLKMRVVINAICAVYQYSREFYIDVCERYDIAQNDQLCAKSNIKSFYSKNSTSMVSEVCIQDIVSCKKQKGIADYNKKDDHFSLTMLCCCFIFGPCIQPCFE